MKKKTAQGSRSPKFPFIPLQKAVSHLPSLAELSGEGVMNRGDIIRALGFESFSGPAARNVAALRAYHLIEGAKQENGLVLTEVGKALTADPEHLESLQISALSPMAFRRIWRKAKLASESELAELLVARGFTEEGSKRAAKVYRLNAALAQLETLEVEPTLPDRSGVNLRQRKIERRLRSQSNCLSLPLSSGNVIVPRGISEEEFQLVLDTLTAWKGQIVQS